MKALRWVGSSKKDLMSMPEEVIDTFGYALDQVQEGEVPDNVKPLHGFGGAGDLEISERYQSDAFRAVYTVRFGDAVYVLHCFQKKSKSGIATPKQDMDLIRLRLKEVEREHLKWIKRKT